MRAFTDSSPLLWLAAYCGLSSVPASASLIRRSDTLEYRSPLLLRAISVDGNCGAKAGTTCLGSEFGDCCSQRGYCGGTNVYCGDGCQSEFGTCGDSSISTDGSCGGSKGLTCLGSFEGDCCSANGFCGKTAGYCGDGCQSAFGICGEAGLSGDGNTAPSSTATSKSSPAASPTSSTSESTSESSPAASPTSSTSDSTTSDGGAETKNEDGGHSTGAKIGMGVGIPVAAIFIGALGLWMFFRRRRNGAVGGSAKDAPDEDAGPGGDGAMAAKSESQAQVPLIILIVGGIGARIQVWGRRLGSGGEEYVVGEEKSGGWWKNRREAPAELGGTELPAELATSK
ncbi:uncharacterized protein DNG_04475 [Cephalotrichum gorgonifer]|uniref:Chitin-binding type-1 domain-containing protein n=1 Tax=Cephalotrichum gorgonifer TaxID=2041049 RepID=A0AAE8SV76_9PEZI|nr:uncharacterized protein DNG_04475 [Cephalotrichum gorgonifer]